MAKLQVRSRREDRRQADERRRNRRSKVSKGWIISKRIAIPEQAIRLRFHEPEKPYADPTAPGVGYPWKKGAKHYIKRVNKFIECGYDKCVVCAYQWPEDFKLEGIQSPKFLKDCYPKDYYSFSAFVLEHHYVIPQETDKTDEDGNPRVYYTRMLEADARAFVEESGQNWSKIKKQLNRVFGRQGYIDISAPAWRYDFEAVFEVIERHTRDGGYLFPLYYACETCMEEMFPVATTCEYCGSEDMRIDAKKHLAICNQCENERALLESRDKDLRESARATYDCPTCEESVPVVPVYAKLLNEETQECDCEMPEDGWDAYDIFDATLTVRVQKTSQDAPPKIVIDEWEIEDLDPRLFDPRYQNEREDEEDAKKRAEYHKRPLNLDVIHRQETPEEAAAILKLDNPFSTKTKTMARTALRYGTKKAVAEESDDD